MKTNVYWNIVPGADITCLTRSLSVDVKNFKYREYKYFKLEVIDYYEK